MREKCWLARWLFGEARHGQIATLGTLLDADAERLRQLHLTVLRDRK